MEFKKETLIKSPLNYMGGGKFKLLPQILPLFPNKVNTFYDLFCGGCNVGINVRAKTVICNDKERHVIDLLNSLLKTTSKQAVAQLWDTIDKYGLSKTNEEGFKKIRSDYNEGNKEWNMFYAIIAHAFNNQIRFNRKGSYNIPFGKNRSSFNPTLEKRFIKFVDKLKEVNIKFTNEDYLNLNIESLSESDFVYCDPPYLITCASYCESGGWGVKQEKDLYQFLDKLNERGIKFALSNVLQNKGKENKLLKEWSRKYTINYLNNSYSNCNYQVKDRTNSTVEVLITNY